MSVNCVQPEARTEMDETWDYDYEQSKEFVGASASATKALGYFEVIDRSYLDRVSRGSIQ